MTMRFAQLGLVPALLLAGCGSTPVAVKTPATKVNASAPAAAALTNPSVRTLEGPAALGATVSVVSSSAVGSAGVLSAGGAAVLSSGGAALVSADEAAGLVGGPEAQPAALAPTEAKSQQLSALAMGPDDPPGLVLRAVESTPPNFFITDRTPYGVVVTERSAHTATIAWRTELPTTGVIEFGRAWGFDKKGYTNELRDEVAKTDHKLTITDLRRWTGYRFRITAYSALGLPFPEQERSFRTKFWSWR